MEGSAHDRRPPFVLPFLSTQGKLLWRGMEGLQTALELVAAAERARESDPSPSAERATSHAPASAPSASASACRSDSDSHPVAYRSGIVRPARSSKQSGDFAKAKKRASGAKAGASATDFFRVLSASEMTHLIPGLNPDCMPEDDASGFFIPSALVLHPPTYLESLWKACTHLARAKSCTLRFEKRGVDSLAALVRAEGADAIVVSSGAATGAIEELRNLVPLVLCHGVTYEARPSADPEAPGYPEGSPSLLGPYYLAVHGPRSITVGATKTWRITPEQARHELEANAWSGRALDESQKFNEAAATGAIGVSQEGRQHMVDEAALLWPSIRDWELERIRTGVRAVPPRTTSGSIPICGLAGYLTVGAGDASSPYAFTSYRATLRDVSGDAAPIASVPLSESAVPVWLATGLGARGLVYHGLVGKATARAVMQRSEDPAAVAGFPMEFLWWRSVADVEAYVRGIEEGMTEAPGKGPAEI